MGQSVIQSTMSNREYEAMIEDLAINTGDPQVFYYTLRLIEERPEIALKLGYVPTKYFKALKHILKEQGKLTEEAMAALKYNIGL